MDVIPAGRRRRKWTDEAKTRIIAASFEPGANIAQIARTHDLLLQQRYAWRHEHIRARDDGAHGGGDPPGVVYSYMLGRGKVWAEKLLGDYTGIVQCDGYSAYKHIEAADRKAGAGPLLFGRLWERLGIGAVLEDQLAGRGLGFAVERAVFVATLHRLFVSGSDHSSVDWMQSYAIEGAEDLALHQFYRAMSWLGEEVEEKAEGALAPRCVKDVIEEKLFDRRRDLFTDLSLVFMDTTSLSFYGAGGETLGKRGHSKDFRRDLAQMILALVVDAQGRPICTEMVPGNTADVTFLLPVVERLRTRFGITRACVVADRGMISADTIDVLEKQGMEYILVG